jgi:acetyl esterase
MVLHPQARALLEARARAGVPPSHTLPVAEARRQLIERQAALPGPREPMVEIADRTLPGPAGDLPIRLYRAVEGARLPVVVYFHGGGWVHGNLDTHDVHARALARASGGLVISVDYRLAPEHPYPAAVEDAYAATHWAAEHGTSLGGDPRRLAVAGDSAGGNLAAAVALMARDRGGPHLAFQLLIYPVIDPDFDRPSYLENAETYGLTRADMQYFWREYARGGPAPYAAVLGADLRGLPPALVITAEHDVLRDEGEAYGAALASAGVPAEVARFPGMIHGFWGMAMFLDDAHKAHERAATAMREALRAGPNAGQSAT